MKHEITLLHSWLEELDLVVDDSTLEGALTHLDWALATNKRLNLTAITDREAALRLHLLDSLTALKLLDADSTGAILDLGTGGGWPGVPLAYATGRHTVLVDSVAKKVEALSGFIESSALGRLAEARAARSEDLALEGVRVETVVARAVAELPVLLELSAPLLDKGGSFIAMKGIPAPSELERADRACELLGFSAGTSISLVLPGGDEARTLLLFRKTGKSRMRVPRRPGMAKTKPLA